MKTDFSDHYSIFTFSNHKITPNITKAITRREFSERNKAKFCKALHNTSWDLLYSIEDTHDAFEYFHSVIQDLFGENFPPHNIKLNYSNKLPWITKGLRVSIKQKHILKNILEKNPTADNKMNYKRHRHALTSLMRTTERRYNEDQLELYKNDLRKVWKIMKEVIGKTNDSRKQDLEMFVDGSISKDPKTIVNAFMIILLILDLSWRVALIAMLTQCHIYQRTPRKVYLFRMSLNMKLLVYFFL